MRILILSSLYPPHFLGGYELRCKTNAEALARRNHEVTILTSRWQVGEGKIEDNVYRQLHFDPLSPHLNPVKSRPDPLRVRRRYNQLKWAFACRENYTITREIVEAHKPDIVYVWNMGGVSISPVLAAQDLEVPTVFNLGDYWLTHLKRDLYLESNPLKRRYRAVMLGLKSFSQINLQNILVNSQSLKQSYVELDFPEKNITVIPRGIPSDLLIDSSEIPNLPRKKHDEVKMIFAGRIEARKGPDVAIEALAHLINEMNIARVSLDIAGTGQDIYLRQLQSMAAALGIEDKVLFLGQLKPQHLHERFLEYDMLLFTSRWVEPFGVTILEAMARGLPVIATDRGGNPEMVSDGQNGLLVQPDDPVMLADAVKKLIENPSLAQRIRHAGLNTVREVFSHERIIDRVEIYLQEVLRESR